MALRRAHMAEQQQQQSGQAQPPAQASALPQPSRAVGRLQQHRNKPQVYLDQYRGILQKALHPKVFSPYELIQGHIPREEAIRRKRAAYDAVSLEQALAERGIDYFREGISGVTEVQGQGGGPKMPSYHRLLPLEAFDDYSYDELSPEDWMMKGKDEETGEQLGVPGLAVRVEDQKGRWVPCKVLEWNTKEHKLLCEWEDTNRRTWLPRVYTYFLAEDPQNFVERVVDANDRRQEAEAILRFNLCVESMPVDDSQILDAPAAERIREISLTNAALFNNEENLNLQGVLKEVNADYGRAMNRQVFERAMQDQTLGHVFQNTPMPKRHRRLNDVAKAPEFGQVRIPDNNFASVLRAFHANTFLNKQDEVIGAIQRIRDECDQVLLTNIFVVPPQIDSLRPLLLHDFEEAQKQSTTNRQSFLKDQWSGNIKSHVKDQFRTTTLQDEVTLAMTSKDQYYGTKTHRFMNTVKFMMQDTLYYLVTASLESYVRFVEEACNYSVEIVDLATVKLTRGSLEICPAEMGHDRREIVKFEPKLPLPPLFKVALKVDDEKAAAAYTVTTEEVRKTIEVIFKTGVTTHQQIPQIENQILDFVFSAQTEYIPSIGCDHPLSLRWLARLRSAVDLATKPLEAYLSTYDRFNDLFALEIGDYCRKYEDSGRSLKEMEGEVNRHLARQQEVLSTIPKSVKLGAFLVDTAEFRKKLSDKCNTLAHKVQEMMARVARHRAEALEKEFGDIRSNLVRPMESPEECVRIDDYIKTIPEKVFDLQTAIKEMRDVFEVLDEFRFPLSDDDFSKKWKVIGWPSRLEEEVAKTEQQLDTQRRHLTELNEKAIDLYAKDLEALQRTVNQFYRHSDIKKVEDTALEVAKVLKTIQEKKETAAKFMQDEIHLDKPEEKRTDFSLVNQIAKDFEPYAVLWETAANWLKWSKSWTEDPFETIDAEEMEKNVLQSWKNMTRVVREPKFKERATILKIAEDIRAQIDEFKPVIPTVKYLRQQGMKERHWKEISQELATPIHPGPGSLETLQDVYSFELMMHEQTLMRVSEIASKEYAIETMLNKMKKDWEPVNWNVKAYKKTNCFVVGKEAVDEIQELLDDHTLNTQSLSFSPFKKQFDAEIEEWDHTIKLVQNVLDEWTTCQKAWMYLEPIFLSEDIVRQLPQEAKRFVQVNSNWKILTTKANEIKNTMTYCVTTEKCLEMFREANDLLDKVQKGLNQYLENKRTSFARFYFLSDQELLTILSEAKDPQKIQPHFRKVFENIDHLEMRAPDNEMFGMYSQMDEYIEFCEPVLPRKNVENWLSEIEAMMKRSIRKELEEGIQKYKTLGPKQFYLTCTGQSCITVGQIYWTAECEKHLKESGSLQPYVDQANKSLMLLVEAVREPLNALQQMNLGGLITIEVHARDIVEKLALAKVDSINAFEWVSQLRSYWTDDDCYLRQVEAQFRYGGESLGNTTRLVITPLTDRIYLTLTGAMHMFLGAAPAGPAGTGKTETVKDLAKAVAKQCVVFNCQEGMTYQSMGNLFKGFANAGAWACFDEFNRIDVEVLSVVAQQVSTLQHAARSKQYRIPFEGTEIVVDPTYSVFITMNPGYAGRTELPDNLKVLFRPVACMVPDYAMIGEIRLFSFGYADARKLSQKMVATFRLSSEQLSSQDHYDFGMRAVNTVISAAGLMKRRHKDDEEDVLLLRALRDSNAPKFLTEDLKLFSGIIGDLFPKTKVPVPDYGQFQKVLEEKTLLHKLQPHELFLLKMIQLFEMTELRHGQMVVGPTMGGKSCATRVLAEAMGTLSNEFKNPRFAEVVTYHLNPKSITMSQLYGGFAEATGEWTDGMIGELFRMAARDTTARRQWIVFDGPVDALWIESMNTVLDENKKLCLISREVITMTPYMNVWFEVEDLAVASPATVSRAGMIYMEPTSCIGVSNFIKSWADFHLPKTMDPHKAAIVEKCESMFPVLLKFVGQSCVEYQPTVWPNLVMSTFNLFNAFMEPFTPTKAFDPPADKLELLHDVHMHLLVFSIVWGIGGALDQASRKKFDKFFKDEIKRAGITLTLPDMGLFYDYEYVLDEKRWILWNDRAPAFNSTVSANTFGDLIVPTNDVVRYKWLLRHLLTKDNHVLCVGPTGTGKTLIINELLMRQMPKEYTPIFFTFSARTSANQTQDLIFSKFEVRRRATPQIYGAPIGKKFCIFIDDVNMPQREKYFAQPPIEILRQWMDYKGWYDRKTREFYKVVDVLYVGAMGPPGGGRNKVTNRFLRHFNFISFPDIDDENMHRIFSTIMESFLKARGFADEIKSRLSAVVDSSIDIFGTICKELRPKPTRPHYLFNMRDIAKIFAGLLNAEPKTCTTTNHLLRLWLHESTRTFRDRLVDEEDRGWFDELLRRQLQKHFKLKWGEVVASERLMFADFLNSNTEIRNYEEVKDMQQLIQVCEQYLEEYNNANTKKMNLVMFLDCVEHIVRISRVIRKPGGHALLLGVGGSGRQSASRLAAHVNEFETRQVEISKGYGMNAWREDIKNILKLISVKDRDKSAVFVITDTQIVNEGMLEDVNNLLNCGEVPNLFFGPDLDEVNNAMKPVCQQESIPLDKVNMYARFVRFCKNNLHIVVCMSPIGEPFRNRLRMFPALVNCCTIDWFSNWPEQALVSVARDFFAQNDIIKGGETLIEQCTRMCVTIHQSVEHMSQKFLDETKRHNYVTPTSYLELLHTFKNLMHSESQKILVTKNRLSNGLEKLRQTETQVAELQANLAKDQPLLIQRKEEIATMVGEIAAETEKAEETRVSASADAKTAEEKTEECTKMYEESETLLAQANPMLLEAVESLKLLKASDFNEVNGYKVYTDGVKLSLTGMCILLGIAPIMKAVNPQMPEKKEPDYVGPSKESLSQGNKLLDRLTNYDKEHIADPVIRKLTPLIKNEDFTAEKIRNASKACAALCMWVHSMYKYHFVLKEVQPLRDKLTQSKKELELVTQKRDAAQAKLKEVEDKLEMLNRNKEAAETEKNELEKKVENTRVKLIRAGLLIDGLAGEKKNWSKTITDLTEREGVLTGDVISAAGQVSYAGAFTSAYRNELLEGWKQSLRELGVHHGPNLSVFSTLQDPVETRKWSLNGLPLDTLSIENALFLKNARRWPLMIDPQTQANKWIRKTYGEQLEILRPNTKDLIKRIEHGIRLGRPVLLENVTEDIDPSLDPLLSKQTFFSGGTEMIRISETAVQWNKDFKFFMTTTLTNPHYIPEIMVKVTLLNFFITPSGLEDQLLGVLVGLEKRELEVQKNALVQDNAASKNELAEIQSTILRMLEEVRGDILEDENLIKYLEVSKVKTEEINVKVAKAEETEREIDQTRELYRPVAYHASILYFCCSSLANVDPMYQYSLQWFVRLFESGVEGAERSEELDARLSNLKDFFTYSFYNNISRSLFEKHKLLFSFVLCVRILQGAEKIDPTEWRFVMSGPPIIVQGPKNPAPDWMTDVAWTELCYLDKELPAFNGLCDHIASHVQHYHTMFMSAKAHSEPFATQQWNERMSQINRMMFLRCLRPDKLMEAVQDFVTANLGLRFIQPPPFDLARIYKDSNCTTPLIFVLSAGADPSEEWKKFADTQNMGKKLHYISLGQGQGPRAERLLKEGTEMGTWVLLQNCHLATSWMPALEALIEAQMVPGINTSFRLWLTSMPSDHFPVSVLQNGVKMTNEPPKGMRANVTRSLMQYGGDFLERCQQPTEFKKLTFSLCFFHALIQERRKFGPLGWNIPYEYTTGDLNCCVSQLKMFLDKYEEVPYKVILELSGHIHYGGRVTDDWDRRTIMTILADFVNVGVMKNDYSFSPSGSYVSIAATDQAGYLKCVDDWPLNTLPEAFGLHENADITCARNETFDTLSTILVLEGGGTGTSGGKSPDEIITELASAIYAKIHAEFDIAAFQEKFPTKLEDSMNTVVVQECIRYNRLITTLRSSLENLRAAIKGLVVMSKDLEGVYKSMQNNQVPEMWADKAYPSLKPLASWVTDLAQRIAMLDKWFDQGHPKVFWISGFYFPQAFLTGILQNFARSQHQSIDTISYGFEWMSKPAEEVKNAPINGCYIYGMYIEGARIDTATLHLAESRPKVLFESAPMVWLMPTINREQPKSGIYLSPLYKTLRRAGTLSTTGHSTNYVLSLEVPTTLTAEHWVKRGVALVCSLNY